MLGDQAPIITQDIGIQPEILRATALEEPRIADDTRKKEARIFRQWLLLPFNCNYGACGGWGTAI